MASRNRQEGTEQTESRELSRSSQQQPMRRGGFDPFQISPGEFFSNPFAVMRRMHEEMDRVFADAFGQRAGWGAMGGLGSGMASWMPAVEVSERDSQLDVCAELPGLRPEDVKVEVTDDALIIEGERKQEHEEKGEGKWLSERQYGKFYRAIPLPEGAKTEDARAEFKNGELRVTVPMDRHQSTRRQIPISGSRSDQSQQK